jgi:hypothetical protein
MNMELSVIALETLGIVLICGFLFASQLFIAKILLKNVKIMVNQLDHNIAEAVKAVIETKINESTPQTPPGLAMIMDLLKNAQKKDELPRDPEGKFTIIEEIKDGKQKTLKDI